MQSTIDSHSASQDWLIKANSTDLCYHHVCDDISWLISELLGSKWNPHRLSHSVSQIHDGRELRRRRIQWCRETDWPKYSSQLIFPPHWHGWKDKKGGDWQKYSTKCIKQTESLSLWSWIPKSLINSTSLTDSNFVFRSPFVENV